MDNILAPIRRCLHRWLRWPTCRVNKQARSLLLNLPLEILFLILDFLPPESSVAVSLTCKVAFYAFCSIMKSRLDTPNLQNLLLLLEESVSRHRFFCHNCTQLHRFSPYWAPGRRKKSSLEPPCKPKTTDFGDIYIGFHHVRLVMNTHLLGPGHGISLRQLQTEILPYWKGWEISSVARILQDQLFLRVSHRLRLHQRRRFNRVALRSGYRHRICHHIITHPCRRNPRDLEAVIPTQIPELRPIADIDLYNDDAVADCNSVPGSCSICMTDFTTTIKQQTDARDPARELLDVTIVSYHLLGHCRSPSDWKWQTFSTRYSRYPPDLMTRAQHQGSCYEPGAVRRRWDMDVTDLTLRRGMAWRQA
ncbi:hypothetical protein F5Y12DRAFT_770316 [Xylaria sp. FL1777]|nr:hypothetical protein F5Y12DRAFT_770316 [Xylaria sp. FL1777]